MLALSQRSKMFIYPILYWIIFIFLPIIIAYIYQNSSSGLNIPGLIMLFIIFVAPFLYFIPYKLIALETKRQKIFFVLFGLIVPFVFLFLFLSYKVLSNFNRSDFPF